MLRGKSAPSVVLLPSKPEVVPVWQRKNSVIGATALELLKGTSTKNPESGSYSFHFELEVMTTSHSGAVVAGAYRFYGFALLPLSPRWRSRCPPSLPRQGATWAVSIVTSVRNFTVTCKKLTQTSPTTDRLMPTTIRQCVFSWASPPIARPA